LVGIAGAGTAGITKDLQFDAHGTDSQDKYLPWVQAIKDKGATYVTVNSNDVAMANMRKEGPDSGRDHRQGLGLHDRLPTRRGSSNSPGTRRRASTSRRPSWPFEEAKFNPAVKAYITSVGGLANTAAFGAEAWVSALFFRDVVKAVVAAKGRERPDPRELADGGPGEPQVQRLTA